MTIRISELNIYPLKSAKAISLGQLELTSKGPKNDRLWMIVRDNEDNRGKFITQRDRGCEKLALIQIILIDKNHTKFITPDGQEIIMKHSDMKKYDGMVRIWKDECEVFDAGDIAAEWISNYLGDKSRLVKIDESFNRKTDPRFSNKDDVVNLADGFPLLITNTASLSELQKHFPAGENISMDRFRANIVLDGLKPFEEDVIKEIKIGDIILELVKPCSRCKLTTVNQNNAEVISNEPLKTLTKFRRGSADGLQGVFFGQNAIPRKLGSINIDGKVEIISLKEQHKALEQCSFKYED